MTQTTTSSFVSRLADRVRTASGKLRDATARHDADTMSDNTGGSDAAPKVAPQSAPSSSGITAPQNAQAPPAENPNDLESWKCMKCKTTSDVNAKMVECEICGAHKCSKCLTLSSTKYEVLSRDDLIWLCSDDCKVHLRALISIKDFIPQVDKINSKLDKIETNLTKSIDNIAPKIAQEITPMMDIEDEETDQEREDETDPERDARSKEGPWQVAKSAKGKSTHLINIMKEALTAQQKENEEIEREKADIESRKMNLMLFNVPEKATPEEDKAAVEALFREEFHMNVSIEEITRFGKKADEHARLTRIVMPSIEEKRMVLKKAKELRDSNNETNKKIYINPDLTKKQQET